MILNKRNGFRGVDEFEIWLLMFNKN